ncbi:hypothetical protein VYU27_010711, partial [Nannochloropsis oceanica]
MKSYGAQSFTEHAAEADREAEEEEEEDENDEDGGGGGGRGGGVQAGKRKKKKPAGGGGGGGAASSGLTLEKLLTGLGVSPEDMASEQVRLQAAHHPKVIRCKELLIDHFNRRANNPEKLYSSRAIVFTGSRASVDTLCAYLAAGEGSRETRHPLARLRPTAFVGQ